MKESKGYVFESNGKWFARITIADPITGKRRNIKRTAYSKPAANELLKQIASQLNSEGSKVVESLSMTFNDLADYYETYYAIPAKVVDNQKIEGLRDYKRILGFIGRFRSYFGTRKLRSIEHHDLAQYRRQRLQTITQYKRQRSITAVNRELSCLRRIFNIAVQRGWVLRSPFACGEPLILTSCEKRRERILSPFEETKLLNACDDPKRSHLKPLLVALLDTGARLGEMLKLTWQDVDLDSRIITIRAQNTKTLRERQVGITERLCAELTTLWQNAKGDTRSLVFGISSNVRRSFKTACNVAGIKQGGLDGLTLHCLRHTAATRLVKGQLPIQLVGRILGHTQVNTTYRYLTADAETAKQATSILESYHSQPLDLASRGR